MMRWVTRKNANVDRVACPWLIKRFVDPQAEFVYVPADTNPATITDGIPYDGVRKLSGEHFTVSMISVVIEESCHDIPKHRF